MKLTELRLRGSGIKTQNGREYSSLRAGKRDPERTKVAPDEGWTLEVHNYGVLATKDGDAFVIPWSLVLAPSAVIAEPAQGVKK